MLAPGAAWLSEEETAAAECDFPFRNAVYLLYADIVDVRRSARLRPVSADSNRKLHAFLIGDCFKIDGNRLPFADAAVKAPRSFQSVFNRNVQAGTAFRLRHIGVDILVQRIEFYTIIRLWLNLDLLINPGVVLVLARNPDALPAETIFASVICVQSVLPS